MNKKIGLVIQGPLLSIGRAGNNLHKSPGLLIKEGGVVEYDCRQNIQKIIDEFGSLFDEIIVSTWDKEVRPTDGWKGAKLISVPDPGGIKQTNSYKDNNKFRQFLSTLNGLKELEKSKIDVAVKIRTDQYLDLKLLLDSYHDKVENHPNPMAIGVTIAHPTTFLLHDLYFIADLQALKRFCEAILSYARFEFISSVHREMMLKHAYKEYKDKINVSDSDYFPMNPPDGVSLGTRKIFDYMFRNVYVSLDPDVFRGTLWRGEYYEEDHVSRLVEVRGSVRKYNLPRLFTTDWDRYFNFRLQTYNTPISFIDKFIVKVGRLGWDIWNLIRKLGRKALSVVR